MKHNKQLIIQLIFVVFVGLVAVVYGGGDAFVPVEPLPVIPSAEPIPDPTATIVVRAIKEPPHTGNGPSFDDVSSMNGNPPDCVYPWMDPLHCK